MRESWLIAVERFLDRDVTNARRVFFLTMWLYRRRKRRRKKKKERKRKSIDALVCTSVGITWNFIHFRMLFLLRKSFVFLILLSRYLHFCILLLFFSPHSNKQYFSYIWLVSRGNVHEFRCMANFYGFQRESILFWSIRKLTDILPYRACVCFWKRI